MDTERTPDSIDHEVARRAADQVALDFLTDHGRPGPGLPDDVHPRPRRGRRPAPGDRPAAPGGVPGRPVARTVPRPGRSPSDGTWRSAGHADAGPPRPPSTGCPDRTPPPPPRTPWRRVNATARSWPPWPRSPATPRRRWLSRPRGTRAGRSPTGSAGPSSPPGPCSAGPAPGCALHRDDRPARQPCRLASTSPRWTAAGPLDDVRGDGPVPGRPVEPAGLPPAVVLVLVADPGQPVGRGRGRGLVERVARLVGGRRAGPGPR